MLLTFFERPESHKNLSHEVVEWCNSRKREKGREMGSQSLLSRSSSKKKLTHTHKHIPARLTNAFLKMFYFHKKLYCVYRALLLNYIYFVHARMRSNDSFLPAGVIVLETSLTVSLIEREWESCAPSQAAVSSCFVWFFFFFFSFPSEEHSEKYF